MTTDTTPEQIVVLGLDAADYRLLRDWECENLLLETHGPLTTVAHTLDGPYTLDIWPTIATGVPPEEHGLGAHEEHHVEWEHPLIRTGQQLAELALPQTVRTWLGAQLMDKAGADHEYDFDTVEADHVFDAVFSWPGADSAPHLSRAWGLWHKIQADDLTEAELDRELMALTREELAWASTSKGLVGTHMHALDVAGHVYCDRPQKLRNWYERVDRLVGSYLDEFDEMVVLSDHGMQVKWLNDDEPGDHSWEATVATTLDGPLPEHVNDVAEWLADQRTGRVARATSRDERPVASEAAKQQIEDIYM